MRISAALGLWLSWGVVSNAQITGVEVVGTTNVQAVLKFNAPAGTSCRVEVFESNARNVVHDVNGNLFPDANLDSRPGNLVDGETRIFVVGKRAVEKARDGKWYSRALQADTLHIYRIQCGQDSASGEFQTATVPVGAFYPWPIPQDPETGNFRWPSVDNADRSQVIIDPNYGTQIRRISVPGDAPEVTLPRRAFRKAAGTNWSSPEAALANDSQSATHAAGSRDWLTLTDPGVTVPASISANGAPDYVVVRIHGSSGGPTPQERTIELCLTIDGATCYSEIRTAVLESSMSTVPVGSPKPVDTWGKALWWADVNANGNFGVMIRRSRAGEARISIQYAEMDIVGSPHPGMADAGSFRVCAPVKSNGGFHCAVAGAGGAGANYMYWIHPGTGEARWLGKIIATGWGGRAQQCLSTNAMWDFEDPNVYYCRAVLNNKVVLLKGTYTGNEEPAAPNAIAQMQWVILTPEPHTITEQIQKFNPTYDPEEYPCRLSSINGQYAIFNCRTGIQNSIGWLAVYDLGNKQPSGAGGTGRIVAATTSFQSPASRWCGIHSVEQISDIPWAGFIPNQLRGTGKGLGPYQVTVQSALPAGADRATINVSGEPAPYLMDAAAGDMFQFSTTAGVDVIRIVEKRSSTEWVVERIVVGTTAAARPPGETITALCGAVHRVGVSGSVYWNFLEDPHGQDATGAKMVAEEILTGGHLVQRGNYRIMAHWTGYQVVTPGAPASFNREASFRLLSNPRWDGRRANAALGNAADGLGNTYQQHPSYENYAAPERNHWFVDVLPFIGAPNLTSSLTPVPGFSRVYRANGVQLNRDVFPTLARCGNRMLKDISPGPITDENQYSYCVGEGCVSGAGSASVFVNCPPPVTAASRCTQSGNGDNNSVCITDLAPFGQSVTQFFLDPSTSLRSRVLTNGLFALHSRRTVMSLDTASPLPDGSWVIFPSYANTARQDLFMVKVPSEPERGPGNDGALISLSMGVTPPGNAHQVAILYGNTPALGSATAPQRCNPGEACTISFKAKPMEVLFTRPVFLDAAGRKVDEGKLGVRISSGLFRQPSRKPKLAAANVVNAASQEQRLSPGGLVSIFGDDLANCEATQATPPLETSLCDSTVTFNNLPGYYLYASPKQINVQIPSALGLGQDVEVVVKRGGESSEPVTIPQAAFRQVVPAIYSYADGAKWRALIQNPDGSLNGPARPLAPNQTAVLFANSLGPTEPKVNDGEAASAEAPATATNTIELYINDVRQPVSFVGLVPGVVGVYQVQFSLDEATPTPPDDQNFVWLNHDLVDGPRLLISLAGPDG